MKQKTRGTKSQSTPAKPYSWTSDQKGNAVLLSIGMKPQTFSRIELEAAIELANPALVLQLKEGLKHCK